MPCASRIWKQLPAGRCSGSRADSASGCDWPWRWQGIRSSWSWTSPLRRWTCWPDGRSGNEPGPRSRRGGLSCSPPTSWRRPTRWPTGWWSSPGVAWSPTGTLSRSKPERRNREILIFRLGIPAAIYLILIAVQDRPGGAEGGVPWQTGRMVALAGLAAVMSGLAAGPSLGEEGGNGRPGQLRVTPMRPSAAVVYKIVVAMSFALPAIALVAAIGGLTADIALSAGQWAQVIGLMWIATALVAAVGTLIGLTFGAESAQNATTLAFVVLWLLGGIFTSPVNMPAVLVAWTAGAGALAALAWRRVMSR